MNFPLLTTRRGDAEHLVNVHPLHNYRSIRTLSRLSRDLDKRALGMLRHNESEESAPGMLKRDGLRRNAHSARRGLQ
jgi:hypothetical protein